MASANSSVAVAAVAAVSSASPALPVARVGGGIRAVSASAVGAVAGAARAEGSAEEGPVASGSLAGAAPPLEPRLAQQLELSRRFATAPEPVSSVASASSVSHRLLKQRVFN